MRSLIVDNYDSYTYNLFQLLSELNGEEAVVVGNDRMTWPEIAEAGFDNIVISPGPGRPEHARDVGISLKVLRHADVPVLGVCLGHQILAYVEGGSIARARTLMHGRLSSIRHDERGLFAGLPQDFRAVRYHSLAVASVPRELRVTARARDGTVMALAHVSRPLYGVQFHPESVCTEYGRRLLRNFRELTPTRRARGRGRPAAVSLRHRGGVEVRTRALPIWRAPHDVFGALFAEHPFVAWLDSAAATPHSGRFSFIAVPDGPLGHRVRYDVGRRRVAVTQGGRQQELDGTVFEFCERRLAELEGGAPELPFDFIGGYVGYLGYELKSDLGGDAAHVSPLTDAALLFCDRLIAFDHQDRRVYLVALSRCDDEAVTEADLWLDTWAHRVDGVGCGPPPAHDAPEESIEFTLADDRASYREKVVACQEEIAAGESYEICLTTVLRSDRAVDPVATYGALRASNPAPYAALLRLGDVSLLSSSPERFLRVDRAGIAESRPIKGTAPRSSDAREDAAAASALATDEKTRAENLMIADLVRNDLGKVCVVGSVEVTALMRVETYATVHQLVTAVRGRLKPATTAIDAVRATFPGGSMTGAPKRRTMEIIDRLEGRPRGPYAGALGFLAVNGTADLSIIIRTLVASADGLSIGAGGAIVAASDPQAEFEEMLVKASAVGAALRGTITDRDPAGPPN